MIAVLLAIVLVSFAAGGVAVGIIALVLGYNPAYQQGRLAERRGLVSRGAVRAACGVSTRPVEALPAAQRDHADVVYLPGIRASRKAARP